MDRPILRYHDLRIEYDHMAAELKAVTKERDQLRERVRELEGKLVEAESGPSIVMKNIVGRTPPVKTED